MKVWKKPKEFPFFSSLQHKKVWLVGSKIWRNEWCLKIFAKYLSLYHIDVQSMPFKLNKLVIVIFISFSKYNFVYRMTKTISLLFKVKSCNFIEFYWDIEGLNILLETWMRWIRVHVVMVTLTITHKAQSSLFMWLATNYSSTTQFLPVIQFIMCTIIDLLLTEHSRSSDLFVKIDHQIRVMPAQVKSTAKSKYSLYINIG